MARPAERQRRSRTPALRAAASRPSGIGRSRVRCISASGSRSMTWLNADAPPATSAGADAPSSSRHDVVRVAAGHHVAGERRDHDQQVQPRLRQRDEVGRCARRARRRRTSRRTSSCVVRSSGSPSRSSASPARVRAAAARLAARRRRRARNAAAEAAQRQHERRRQHQRAVDDVRGVDDGCRPDQIDEARRA